LVNINDFEEIVSAIVKLARNEELRRELGKKGRKLIKEYLTWNAISDELIELFQNQIQS
jgi:glycosyltransferase involved in cell wall biosynthesis